MEWLAKKVDQVQSCINRPHTNVVMKINYNPTIAQMKKGANNELIIRTKIEALKERRAEAIREENEKLSRRGFGYAQRHVKLYFSTVKSDGLRRRIEELEKLLPKLEKSRTEEINDELQSLSTVREMLFWDPIGIGNVDRRVEELEAEKNDIQEILFVKFSEEMTKVVEEIDLIDLFFHREYTKSLSQSEIIAEIEDSHQSFLDSGWDLDEIKESDSFLKFKSVALTKIVRFLYNNNYDRESFLASIFEDWKKNLSLLEEILQEDEV